MSNKVAEEILEQIAETKSDEAMIVITETISSLETRTPLADVEQALDKIRRSGSPMTSFRIVDRELSRNFLLYMDQYLTNLDSKTKEAARSLNDTDMTRFIKSINTLYQPNCNAGEKEKADHLLKHFAKSGSYRLCYPEHLVDAQKFISNFIDGLGRKQFEELWNKATAEERYRIYELRGMPQDQFARSRPQFQEIHRSSAQFAMGQNPQTLVEFAETYQFFLKCCAEIEREFNTQFPLKQDRNNNIQSFKERLSEEHHRYGKLLNQYREVARVVGVGPLECDVQIKGEQIRDLRAQLKFKSDSGLAYHVLKHYNEIPSNLSHDEPTLSLVDLKKELKEELHDILAKTVRYLEAARAVVHKGKFEVYPNQFKGDVFKFECEAINLKTFVKLADGKAVIATCMNLK